MKRMNSLHPLTRWTLAFVALALAPCVAAAMDRVVDPNVAESNGIDLFATVHEAVDAAEDGDRILITPGVYDEPALTVTKSLTFQPLDGEGVVAFGANVTLDLADDRTIVFALTELGQYHLTLTNTGARSRVTLMNCQATSLTVDTPGQQSDEGRSELHLLDSQFDERINASVDGWNVNVIRCTTPVLNYRQGNVVLSTIHTVTLLDEAGGHMDGHRNTVVQSDISVLVISNDNRPARIVNNALNQISWTLWDPEADHNDVLNNEFASGASLAFAENPSSYNLRVNNNVFEAQPTIGATTESRLPLGELSPAAVASLAQQVNQIYSNFFDPNTGEHQHCDNVNGCNYGDCNNNASFYNGCPRPGCRVYAPDLSLGSSFTNAQWNPNAGTWTVSYDMPTMWDCRWDQQCGGSAANYEIGGNCDGWDLGNPAPLTLEFDGASAFSGNENDFIAISNNANIPNQSTPGFFEWVHNTHPLNNNEPNESDPLVFSEFGISDTLVNGGAPDHEYYDVNLSINDKGRDGGPWGTANFPADSDAKGFIFDIDIPTDLYPGQDIDLKVKAYHRY